MKKLHHLFLWACLALSVGAFAQIDSSGPQGLIDTVFSGLDAGKISTGLLADKTLSPYVSLKEYDGATDKPISFDNALLLTFVLNRMNTGINYMPDETKIKAIYEQHNLHKLLVPLILDYNYNQISSNAYADGLIDTSGYIWTDTIINGVSPYTLKTLKATALNSNWVTDAAFRFMFDPRLYFTNNSKPGFLLVDFDDGNGIQAINAFDTITVQYSSTGEHKVVFYKTVYGNDESEKLNVATVKSEATAKRTNNADCMFTYTSSKTIYKYNTKTRLIGYDANGNAIFDHVSYPQYMQALVSVQMGLDKKGGAKHQCLKKPLIFIDGIDFGYKNRVDEMFLTANKCNTLGYDNFTNAADLDPITGKEVIDIRFMHGPEFAKGAIEAGYDIIFFDFLYGAADIRLNANLVKEFIISMNSGSINQASCFCGKSYDEIVLIGASLGGQVARYALLDMESNNINHCVREWISFDSPNQGANIPLGLQSFLEWSAANNGGAFNVFNASVDNLTRKLDRDASKQLLTYHYSDKYQSRAHWMFYDFYTAIDKMGKYPSKCRKAAVANGSLNAKQQDYGTKYNMYGGGELLAEVNLPFNFLFKWMYNYQAKIYAQEGATLNGTKCSYDNSRKYVFDGNLERWFPSRILPLHHSLKCTGIPFYGYGFDYAPGGTNDGIMALDNTIPLTGLLIAKPGKVFHENFSFIPTVSALGVNPDIWTTNSGPMFNITNAFGVANIEKHLPNYGVSPFDAVFGPYGGTPNELHVFISKPLIAWALDELAMGDYDNELAANGNGGNSYNFGDFYFNRLKSITVHAACSLKVFADDYKGYKNRKAGYESQYYASIDKPVNKGIFELFTNDNCAPTHVKIEGGGVFEHGDGIGRQAITRFRKGSILELMEGAVLHIHEGSVVIIEKGAQIIYHKGARIILDGTTAVLQLYGELVLPDNDTKFTFEHSPTMPNGFIDFVNSPVISSKGTTNSIELAGTSVSSKIARLSGNLILKGLNAATNDALASVTFKNGEVQLLGKSSLKTDATFTASFVNFNGTGSNYGNSGLVLYGQPSISISNCRFQNLTTGLEILKTYNNGAPVLLEHNLFSRCTTGAMFILLPVEVKHSNFINCGTAITADLCNKFKAEHTSFSNNGTALNYIGSNAISGVVRGCNFRLNTNAIRESGSGSSLTIACSDIRNCTSAVYAEGKINMSKLQADKDYGILGGECNFLNNNYFFSMNYGTLDLYDGNNNFIQADPAKVTNYVNGNIDANALAMLVFPPNILEVENNYWSPDPSVNSLLYNFSMTTFSASYTGILGITNPVGSPYSNCASTSNNGGVGVGGDLNGAGGSDPLTGIDNLVQGNDLAHESYSNTGSGDGNEVLIAYPIPASDILTLEIKESDPVAVNCITFTNSVGVSSEINYEVTANGIIKVNVGGIPNGSYFITVTTSRDVYRKAVIILHE